MFKPLSAVACALLITGSLVASASVAGAAAKAGATCSKKEKGRVSGKLTCKTNAKGKLVWTAAAAADATPASTTTPAPTAAKLSGSVKVDGSSTVFPISEAAAELFSKDGVGKDVKVTVGESGTGGGFKKFCAGETDISNASRPISESEKKACADKGIQYREFLVANDGLSLVVNPQNNWASCMTTADLKKIWDAGSKITNWKDVNELYPNTPLKLFGAGTASGTFDFFSEAINGKAKQHRSDYNATEDDNVTVVGVAGSLGGLGYFGLSYALENATKVKLMAIDNGSGKCVLPSSTTVQDGTYKPLGRPLFMYVAASALKRPEVLGFVEYFLENLDPLAKRTLFIPLTAAQKVTTKAALDELKKL